MKYFESRRHPRLAARAPKMPALVLLGVWEQGHTHNGLEDGVLRMEEPLVGVHGMPDFLRTGGRRPGRPGYANMNPHLWLVGVVLVGAGGRCPICWTRMRRRMRGTYRHYGSEIHAQAPLGYL